MNDDTRSTDRNRILFGLAGTLAIVLGVVGLAYVPIGLGEGGADETIVETTYKLAELSVRTPAAECEALRASIAAIDGVEQVEIRKARKHLWVRHLADIDVAAVNRAIIEAGFSLPVRVAQPARTDYAPSPEGENSRSTE